MSWFSRKPKPTLEEIVRREVKAAVSEAMAPFTQLIVATAAEYAQITGLPKRGSLDDIELAFATPPDPDPEPNGDPST